MTKVFQVMLQMSDTFFHSILIPMLILNNLIQTEEFNRMSNARNCISISAAKEMLPFIAQMFLFYVFRKSPRGDVF